MGESTKRVCAFLMIMGVFAGVVAWYTDGAGATTWAFRIGGPATVILALGLILVLHFRADREPDYLRSVAGKYFNRDGFCFAFDVSAIDGIAFMEAYFQSQFDRPSLGRIAARPARGFFLTRAKIDAITFEIECPPAGFGYARIAIPIPEALQGKRQAFDVGAFVDYPEGHGRRVRFHDGVLVRRNSDLGDSLGTTLKIAGAATGSVALVLSKPATAKIDLPIGVAEDIPDNLAPEITTLWQLGDPTLTEIA